MSASANVVIIGSGIVGNSVAYHLAKMGWSDIMVVDKGPLHWNHGSTSHAPGGVVPLAHSKLMSQLGIYSAEFYREIEKTNTTGLPTVFPVGQLEVAISERRIRDLTRLKGSAKAFGAESHVLTPEEAVEMNSFVNKDAITGALFIPLGAIVRGARASELLQKNVAEMTTASFVGDTPVTGFDIQNGQIKAVLTSNSEMPRIDCEHVVLAANIWTPAMTEEYGINIPLMPFEHQYMQTEVLEELSYIDANDPTQEVTIPTTRELDSVMYYRQHHNRYGIGSYHHPALAVSPKFLHADMSRTAMHDFTPEDYFGEPERLAHEVLPVLKGKTLHEPFNGIFAFPIDGYPIMGETHIKGFWSAAGSWLTHGPGVGKCLAEWMTEGQTEWDMRQVDVRRFHDFQTTEKYVSIVTAKNYREIYDVIHPKQPLTEPRNVRVSPFDARHRELGADFTVFAGIELPNWYEANAHLVDKYKEQIPERSGWEAEFWSPIQGAEHLETRNNVAMFDLTGLSIIEVKGSGVVDYIDYLCSNKTKTEIGKVVYTCMLTQEGGIKRDLAVCRMTEDSYWMFVGEGNLPLDRDWIERNAPVEGVTVTDLSNSYTAVGLWGPNARHVLAKATNANLNSESFKYFTAKWIDIGMTKVLALRLSYAGELGWELHFPFDAATPVWDELWKAGQEFDMIAAGQGAFDSLRLEKGYRGWGTDIHTEYNPYEAGMGWTVRLKKGDFIGREACAKLKAEPLSKKLCAITLNEGGVAMGYEAIYANGNVVAHTTSGNTAYSVGTQICYAYLPIELAEEGTQLELEYLGERYAAVVSADPIYDAKMEKLLA